MENIIYTDADLNAFLVANEEQDGNTIEVVIECDSTESQSLTITAGLASATEELSPGEKNRVDIPAMLWNFGDDTVITLTKGGSTAGMITIHFPGAIEFDAALNETETDNEFTMQGSATVEQQVVSLQKDVERVSAQTLDYILPSAISQEAIADGGSNTVETFEFEAAAENVKVSLFTCIQFLATTTVTAGNAYDDLNLTITVSLDGEAVATILHSYRDGRQVFTLNYLVEGIIKGNHTVTVSVAAAGGSVSVIQVVAAYMLAAKSTTTGSAQVYNLFENGEWAEGALIDGLDANKMTKAANLNGVENTIMKKSLAPSFGQGMPNISTLSAWFNTSYLLLNGQYYAENYYIDTDGTYTRDGDHGSHESATGQPISDTNSDMYIPIKRVTGYTQFQYKAKMRKNNGENPYVHMSFNNVLMGVAFVKNGVLTKRWGVIEADVAEWKTYNVDISDLPYVDYIILSGADGAPQYKDFVLIKT